MGSEFEEQYEKIKKGINEKKAIGLSSYRFPEKFFFDIIFKLANDGFDVKICQKGSTETGIEVCWDQQEEGRIGDVTIYLADGTRYRVNI